MYRYQDNSLIVIVLLIVLIVGGAFAADLYKAVIVQQALNTQCGTHYNLMQVSLAGDNLQKLCQIQNQQITIKK